MSEKNRFENPEKQVRIPTPEEIEELKKEGKDMKLGDETKKKLRKEFNRYHAEKN